MPALFNALWRSRIVRGSAILIVALILATCVFSAWLGLPEPVIDVRNSASGAIYFGGPDKPAGALRDELLRRIKATPAGQSIDWATYYFLDRDLAAALIAASDRGVKVTLVVEGDPRLESANSAVLARLRRHGLRGGLVIRPAAGFPFEAVSGKLHLKIYAFSWPRPVALVGSFNPSGGRDDSDAATIREIGDQDRGHNLLVSIVSPGLVRALVGHVHALAAAHGSISRFAAGQNRIVADRDTALFFYPRLRADIVEQAVDRLGHGDHLWAAISHLKNEAVGTLIDARERGASLALIVHDTERRVPQRAIDRLRANGVSVRRYHSAEGLPMHAKFFILSHAGVRTAYFGSLNFNRNSRLLNDELLVRSTNPALIDGLLARFAVLDAEVDRQEAR